MSDDTTPNDPAPNDPAPSEELTDEEAARLGVGRLRQLAAHGGKQVTTYRCERCNAPNRVERDVADPAELLKVVQWLVARTEGTPADVDAAAAKLGQDLSEMSTEDLRRLYVSLGGEAADV